jgi:hypothetical protein
VERGDTLTAGRWTFVAITPTAAYADSDIGAGVTVSYRVTPLRGRWIGTTSAVVPVSTPTPTSVAGC